MGSGISLLNRSEMYGANGLMCGLVRVLYFTQIVGMPGCIIGRLCLWGLCLLPGRIQSICTLNFTLMFL